MKRGAALLAALTGDEATETLFSDAADLEAMLQVEAALAAAEADAGLISRDAATRIAQVCQSFQPEDTALAAGMARDGVVVPALVKQLRAAVGEPHGTAVHVGATSQDIIDTSLVIRLKHVVALFEGRLDHLVAGLSHLRERDGSRPVMAHTRMQAALPITAADKLETWMDPLIRHRTRLETIKPRLLVLQLGGPVGTRAELGEQADAVAAGMAARLGLARAAPWHSQRDGLAEFGSWLSLLSGSLGKIGQDVGLMTQTEVAALKLAGGGTSSSMAHKQNPVAAEVLVALSRFNAGLIGTLHGALVHENERSGAAWTLEWLVLPQMAIATGAGLRLATALVDGLRFT